MIKHLKKISAVIPAAGGSTNSILSNSNLPDCMVPINGKPVIGYIIEDLFSRGIRKIFITLHPSDTFTEKYLKKKFSHKCNLSIIYNQETKRGLGYSIYLAAQQIHPKDSVFTILGDTIYKGSLDLKQNFMVTSKDYEQSEKWCFVEKSKKGLKFINKPKVYEGGTILSGIYFFKRGLELQQSCNDLANLKTSIEMSDILESYSKNNTFDLIPASGWYDCGNIENYYKAKIDFLKIRSFNSLSYNDLYGYVTKKSDNTQKLLEEINWYLNIPKDLSIFMPRLVDCEIQSKKPSYSLEFYGYQTLADSFLFESIDQPIWHTIIDRLLEIVTLFKAHNADVPASDYHSVYYQKTLDRLDQLQKYKYWRTLLQKKNIKINGVSYKNIPYLLPKIKNKISDLIDPSEMSFMHGDLFLGNILFDATSKLFKFIDPKGSFGTVGVHGDTKYDLSKLRHSFNGKYDFIVGDLFSINDDENLFEMKIFSETYHDQIAAYFDKALIKHGFKLGQIKLIEGLLFLSMIPLHQDNFLRQQAMFCTSIIILNEVLA